MIFLVDMVEERGDLVKEAAVRRQRVVKSVGSCVVELSDAGTKRKLK